MNPILQEQNKPVQIDRLAAQRQLYSDAKRLQLIHLILSVPCVVALSFVALVFPHLKPWALFWNGAITLLDICLLSVRQEELRTRAAKIQELFDCDVLQLPCRELKGASKVSVEEIDQAATRYKRSHPDTSDLRNWYSVYIEPLPIPLARIICQRTNCWWDSDVRRRYANFVLWALLALSVLVVGLGLFRNANLGDWTVSILAPLIPMWVWGLRQTRDQVKTATKLDRLREHADRLWKEALSDASASPSERNDAKLREASRELQDEIYEHRRSNQPMFDRIHRRLRSEMQDRMNRSAQQYAEQAQEHLAKPGG